MVKKIVSVILSTIVVGINILSCVIYPINDLTAIERDRINNTYYIIIDDEVIALSGDPSSISAASSLILDNINIQRTAGGLVTLTQTNELMAAATVRAKEQVENFSHTRPDGSEFWTVDSSVCYGECLSRGYNENEVTTAWMNSPTHKAVIMDGSYKTAGVGICTNDNICFIALETGF